MSEKETRTTSTTRTKTTSFSMNKIFRMVSFGSVIIIALALIFSKIIPSISTALQQIGNILAYIVVLASSFGYVRYKRNVWYFVAWIVALILIVLFIFLK